MLHSGCPAPSIWGRLCGRQEAAETVSVASGHLQILAGIQEEPSHLHILGMMLLALSLLMWSGAGWSRSCLPFRLRAPALRAWASHDGHFTDEETEARSREPGLRVPP